MTYVTTQTVADLVGVNWFGTGDAGLAVQLANAWLSAKNLPEYDTIDAVPDDIKRAGAEIAKEVAKGNLFAGSKEGVVASKAIKAGSVSTSKTYVEGTSAITAGEQIALMLIKPYIEAAPTRFVSLALGRY